MSYKEYTVTVHDNGTKYWYLNGKLHREDGPAIEWADGSNYWYLNDIRHREDGPAVELADGSKLWYLNGMLHREDGPAVEHADGSKYWYLNDKEYTEAKFKKKMVPVKEYTVAELEAILGHSVKIVKDNP